MATTTTTTEGDRLEGDKETAKTVAVPVDAKKDRSVLDDPQTHTDFTANLDACVAQGTRDDMDATASGQAAVERVWIMSRPPGLGRGARPTVTARRAYVVLRHVQGQTVDPGEPVCETVCRPAVEDAAVATNDPSNRPAAVCSARCGYSKCD